MEDEVALQICEGMTTELDLDRLGKNLWRFLTRYDVEWRNPESVAYPQWNIEIFLLLLEEALEHLDGQSLVQPVEEGPYTVFGPLDAQGDSLASLLSIMPSLKERKVIFLGNYFGYGFASLEVFAFILTLKCRYPEDVFLLRGAHEDKSALDTLGLDAWMRLRFCLPSSDDHMEDVYDLLEELLTELSLVALLANNVVCMFGAPGPILLEYGLNLLYGLNKGESRNDLEAGAIAECLWTCVNADERQSTRDSTTPTVSMAQMSDFCRNENISLLIRGRQIVPCGALNQPSTVITICSALCFLDQYTNDACALSIDGKRLTFHRIEMKEENQKSTDLVKLPPGKNTVHK